MTAVGWHNLRLKIKIFSAGFGRRSLSIGKFLRCKVIFRKLLRKALQLTIVQVDLILEAIRLDIIRSINNQTNTVQHRLFLASMWVDRRLDS
jgi:hypothetical protein